MITTNTPLGAGATFTSAWEPCSAFERIKGCLVTDQDGTFYIEWSMDTSGSKVVHAQETFSVAATVPIGFDFPNVGAFFRLKLTNGATPQTSFKMFGWAYDAVSR